MPKTTFYAVAVGRKPGIYTNPADADNQTLGYRGACVRKFETLELAQRFLVSKLTYCTKIDPLANEAFYAVTSGRKPGIYSNWKDAHKQTLCYSGSLSKKFYTLELAQSFLMLNMIYSEPSVECSECKNKSRCVPKEEKREEECSSIDPTEPTYYRPYSSDDQAPFGYIRKNATQEMCDLHANYIVLRKLKMNESGTYEPNLRPTESVVIFASGRVLDMPGGRRSGIGVYWGPYHPLNISKRITGNQTVERAKKYAVVHALYQAKQINAVNVTLYCNWSDILVFSLDVNNLNYINCSKVKNKESSVALYFAHQGLTTKYEYIQSSKNRRNNKHFGRYNIAEASKLAIAGCKLCVNTKNLSEFQNVHKQLSNSLDAPNRIPIIQHQSTSSASVKIVSPQDSVKVEACYYAVHRGHVPGVYYSWADFRKQVTNFINPVFKHCYSEDEAKQFVLVGGVSESGLLNLFSETELNEDEEMKSVHPNKLIAIETTTPPDCVKEEPCYYAVHRGHVPGVYYNWADFSKQVTDFLNPVFKQCYSEDEAKRFVLVGGGSEGDLLNIFSATELNEDEAMPSDDSSTQNLQEKLIAPKIEVDE